MTRATFAYALRCVRTFTALLACAWVAGCAVMWPQSVQLLNDWPHDLPPVAELREVPFYPQRDYECGPAALAMVLEHAGVKTGLHDLIAQVYVPERQGSLQAEMLAAPRRHGLLTTVLPPRLPDVLREVADGTPVIVLQNYGIGPFDQWHYAVVAGYDSTRGEVVLRSGERERLVVTFPVFELLWRKGAHWAMVAVPPQRVPATVAEQRHREAVLALARVAKPETARVAYAAAVERWPASVAARVAIANDHYERGELAQAEAHLTIARGHDPDSVIVLNNLAQTLSDQGRHAEALALTERALVLESPFKPAVQETQATIRERMRDAR